MGAMDNLTRNRRLHSSDLMGVDGRLRAHREHHR